MAEAFFSHQDGEEGQEKDEGYSMTMTIEEGSPFRRGFMSEESMPEETLAEESLSLLARLEKYADSDNIFNRQIVVRSLLEALRTTTSAPGTTSTVLTVMNHLSDDTEPSVRAELMEQVPHIAMFCQENQNHLSDVTSLLLLPVVVKYLMDPNNQVRKTSQAALLVLLEQKLVSTGDIEEQVCPVVLRLTETDSFDDFRTEAVALICKMAPLLGQKMTERSFLVRFASLCTDALFHVRKVCAANFGDFCSVVGLQATEETLVKRFAFLCEDGVWGVRKACADVSTQVSCLCTPVVRHCVLAPLFLNLLRDQSRWVRMAAYQALGSFISTFADPHKTGIYMSEDGLRVVHTSQNLTHATNDGEANGKNLCCTTCQTLCDPISVGSLSKEELSPDTPKWFYGKRVVLRTHDASAAVQHVESVPQCLVLRLDGCDSFVEDEDSVSCSENRLCASPSAHVCTGNVLSEDSAFNSFNFWRSPLPDIELDVDIVGNTVKTNCDYKESLAPSSEHHSDNDAQPSVQLSLTESSVGGLLLAPDCLELLTEVSELDLSSDTCKTLAAFNAANAVGETRERVGSAIVTESPPTAAVHQKVCAKASLEGSKAATAVKVHADLDQCDSHCQLTQPDGQDLLGDKCKTLAAADAAGVAQAQHGSLGSLDLEVKEYSPSFNVSSREAQKHLDERDSHHQLTQLDGLDLSSDKCNTLAAADAAGVAQAQHESVGSPDLEVVAEYSPGQLPLKFNVYSREARKHLDQSIVPEDLLKHYLSMTNTVHDQTVDSEIVRHCAYSIPAVAMTLGRRNWHLLKDLYEILASDMQWKVRRTLAFSIHEVAMIIGEDLAMTDLVPVFNSFLKDLDEVRIGVLHHLRDFLQFLRPHERRFYLPTLSDFLRPDNDCNWRFRLELVEQLGLISDLFCLTDIKNYLMPIAIELVADKVAQVRRAALRIVSILLRVMSQVSDPPLIEEILKDLAQQFAHDRKWVRRQTFVLLSSQLLEEKALSTAHFSEEVLPVLVGLSYDPVPNVRLSVAKTLRQALSPQENSTNRPTPYQQTLLETLQRLTSDKDRDVRFFATIEQTTFDLVPRV